VTPKKAALRAEIFNVEILEALLEQEPDDEDDIITNVIMQRRHVKQMSGSKKARLDSN
jgi:hypothetical protein